MPSVEHTHTNTPTKGFSDELCQMWTHLKYFEELNAYVLVKKFPFFCSTNLNGRPFILKPDQATQIKVKEKRDLRKLRFVYSFHCVLFLVRKSQEDRKSSRIAKVLLNEYHWLSCCCDVFFVFALISKFSHVISAFRVLSNWVERERVSESYFVCTCYSSFSVFVLLLPLMLLHISQSIAHKSIH